MRWPFVWRKTSDAETQAWKERAGEYLKRAEKAERAAATEASAKRTIAELYSDLCDSHGLPVPVDPDRPDRAQALQAMARFDEAQARQGADQIAALFTEAAKARAEAAEERRRADGLQTQLDDALGLNKPAVAAGSDWQDRRETRMKYDPPTTTPTTKETSAS